MAHCGSTRCTISKTFPAPVKTWWHFRYCSNRLQPDGNRHGTDLRTQCGCDWPDQFEVACPRQDFLKSDRQFESGQPGSRTAMGAATKRQVVLDIRALQDELIRIRKHRFIAICR